MSTDYSRTQPVSMHKLNALLDTLEKGDVALRTSADSKGPLPALLEQLQEQSAAAQAQAPVPVRMIHHFACTGGTLISRYLAATPNARLLSEIDPLSTLSKNRFSPLDLALQYRNAGASTQHETLIAIFQAGLDVIYKKTSMQGERLILRDHTHSHYCSGPRIPERPTLRAIVAAQFPTLSVLTVRHPLDSYLSLIANEFTHFTPLTLDEYATRYLAFLDAYKDVPLFKYEDFIENYETTAQAICAALELPYRKNLGDIAPAIALTGDSGRKGITLALRPRRTLSDDMQEMAKTSKAYHALCNRLEYSTQDAPAAPHGGEPQAPQTGNN